MTRVRKPVRNGWVIKIVRGSRGITLELTPRRLVSIALLALLASSACSYLVLSYRRGVEARVEALQDSQRTLKAALALKEREKEQMLSLAEERFQELWDALESQDQELAKIGQVVGAGGRRQSLKGARGARSVQHPLRLKRRFHQLAGALEARSGDLGQLKEAAESWRRGIERRRRMARLEATPSGWPCAGRLSSGFGWRLHPVYGSARFHGGLDFSAPHGAPIQASAAGVVVLAGPHGGYGNTVILDHGNGLSTLYGHCAWLAVRAGARVLKGQTVAYVGSTGVSTGPHLHYEVLRGGQQLDPARFLDRSL